MENERKVTKWSRVLFDDKTRFVWVYFLKRKDQVFEKFIEWKTMVERSTGKKLKAIRTDNGGEFTSGKFKAHLKAEGVCHELTIPRNPEQNGVAERMNRTLVEATRSMLFNANLPHKFWAEALSTATYLRNRSPTKAVTPHESLTPARRDEVEPVEQQVGSLRGQVGNFLPRRELKALMRTRLMAMEVRELVNFVFHHLSTVATLPRALRACAVANSLHIRGKPLCNCSLSCALIYSK